MKIYQELAQLLEARADCQNSGNTEWAIKHETRIRQIINEYLPYGAGFDYSTQIDLEKSTPDLLVFNIKFHHMNNNGFYTNWTTHQVIVRPSLGFGIKLRITGLNYQQIKNYIHECFHDALDTELKEKN